MKYKYSPFDIAIYFKTENLTIREEYLIVESLWEKHKELLQDCYCKEKKIFLNSLKHELYKIEGILDCADEINLILKEMGSSYRVGELEFEHNVIDSYFKVIKLRLSYTHGTEYCRIKLRTLIRAFGYKRRTAALVEYINSTIDSLGMKVYLRGKEPCSIGEVSLDKVIVIRLK